MLKSLLITGGILMVISFTSFFQEDVSANDFQMGIVLQSHNNPLSIQDQLSILNASLASSIRDGIQWQKTENANGTYQFQPKTASIIDWSTANRINPLFVLAGVAPEHLGSKRPLSQDLFLPFANFAQNTFRKTGSLGAIYEIGNEWDANNSAKQRTPKGKEFLLSYIELLKFLRKSMTDTGTNALLIGPAMTGYGVKLGSLSYMAENGLLDYLDGISFHAYQSKNDLRVNRTPEALYSWIISIENELSVYNSGDPVPLYISEFGWPSNIHKPNSKIPGVTEDGQAHFLLRGFILLSSLDYVKGAWWYNLLEKESTEGSFLYGKNNSEAHFGLAQLSESHNKVRTKPAFTAFHNLAPYLKDARAILFTHLVPHDVWIAQLGGNERQPVLAIWSSSDTHAMAVSLASEKELHYKSLSNGIDNWEKITGNTLVLNSDVLLLRGDIEPHNIQFIGAKHPIDSIQMSDRTHWKKPQSVLD